MFRRLWRKLVDYVQGPKYELWISYQPNTFGEKETHKFIVKKKVKFGPKHIIFIDPFNNIEGINAFKKIFYHMFENVKEPKFFILDYSINKKRVFLKWKMTFFAFKSSQTIEGMSELLLSDVGKVVSHTDYWDSLNGLLIKIPFIGYFYKNSLLMFKTKT